MRARSSLAVLLAVVSLPVLPGIALAQSGPQTQLQAQTQTQMQTLQEVVVTAQKRRQDIEQVGIAITALSGRELEARGVTDVQALGTQAPSLQVEDPGSPANTTLTIRGVGTRDIGPNAEGAIALYRDGAYAAFDTTAAMPLFDVARIEVDEGPQGTLFGRNATGGLIQIVSNAPTETPAGYVRLTAGDYGTLGAETAVSGPVAGGLLGRISLYTDRHDGWIRNSNGADGNSLEDYAGRAQLETDPGRPLRARLITYFNSARGDGMGDYQSPLAIDPATGEEAVPSSAAQYAAYCNAAFSNFGLAGAMGYTLAPAGSWRSGNCFYPGSGRPDHVAFSTAPYRNQNLGVTLTVDDRLGGTTLTSITDYQRMLARYTGDVDGTPLPLFYYRQNSDGWQFSQEVHATGGNRAMRWVAGLYYLHVDMDGYSEGDWRGLPTLLSDMSTSFTQKTDSVAAFAQGNYRFARQWTLVAGARWTRDLKSIVLNHDCIGNSNFGYVPTAAGALPICTFYAVAVAPGSLQFSGSTPLSFASGAWSGKLQLEYRPTDRLMTYAGVNRGFKSGGFNATVPQFYGASVATYAPEKLTSYEAGFKSTLFGGRMRLNGSAFHYNYDGFQSYLVVDGFLRTINVQSKVNGAELDLEAKPFRGWYFQAGPSYLDSYSTVPLPSGTGTGRFVNPASPRWTIDALARYERPMAGGVLALQVNTTHMTWRSTNAVDVQALRLPAYWREDARLSFASGNGHWDAALFVKNLTDQAILIDRVSLATLMGSAENIYDIPREWGGTVSYRW